MLHQMSSHTEWERAQEFERGFWGNCVNTFSEEQKQLAYAPRMGLHSLDNVGHWPTYDLDGASVIDIGGGPCSMLLKCTRLGTSVVVDPCPYPSWVLTRYYAAGIGYLPQRGEDLEGEHFDEAWIYNVLQHVRDPELVISRARALVSRVRLFEWIDMPTYDGHPHTLREEELASWLGGAGETAEIAEWGAVGRCFYGVFDS